MKIVSIEPEITFDDVLLLPGYSEFLPEKEKEYISLKTKLTNKISLDIPLISSPMPGITEDQMAITIGKMGGIGIIHAFQSFSKQLQQVNKVKKQNVKVSAAIMDLSAKGLKHAGQLLKNGVDLISIETGHAHNKQAITFVKALKIKYPYSQISVSLIVTGRATEDLIKAGADNIRVGIGGGSHCTTRLVTGIGRPQLSALQNCYKITKEYDIPLMSDTGIKNSGDIPKAIAFGADTVMIGGLFAGTTESPGETIQLNGKKIKQTWGMCTDTAMRQAQVYSYSSKNIFKRILPKLNSDSSTKLFEEGIEKLIPYKGSVKPIIQQIVEGTTRSMWYMGATDLVNLRNNAQVIITSNNTQLENTPRI